VIEINGIEIYAFGNRNLFAFTNYMLILPITSNQLVYKAIISASAQKNAWVVQFTIYYHWQSVINKALPCQTPT